MSIVLDDELQELLLLGLLPESWETLVVFVSNSVLNGILTVNYIINGLLNEEIRRKSSGVSSSQVLAKEVELHVTIHIFDKSPSQDPRQESRNKIICHYCRGAHSHKEAVLEVLERKDRRKNQRKQHTLNLHGKPSKIRETTKPLDQIC